MLNNGGQWEQEIPKLIDQDREKNRLANEQEQQQVEIDKRPYLVIDTNAFIKHIDLNQLSKEYILVTSNGVLREIRDHTSKQKLETLIEPLIIEECSGSAMSFIQNFSIQTGDFASLSKVDMDLVGVAYTLAQKKGKTDLLRKSPPVPQNYFQNVIEEDQEKQEEENLTEEQKKEIDEGWLRIEEKRKALFDEKEIEKKETEKTQENQIEKKKPKAHQLAEQSIQQSLKQSLENQSQQNQGKKQNKKKKNKGKLMAEISDEEEQNETIQKQEKEQENNKEQIEIEEQLKEQGIVIQNIDNSEKINEENIIEDEEEWADEDDGEGWINQKNIDIYLAKSKEIDQKFQELGIFLMTADFAMQNVSLQIGIPVLSQDGMVVNRAKRFILECYACKKLCRDPTKIFCPECGNNALLKVSCSIGVDGQIYLYRKKDFRVNTKGFIFDIPRKTTDRRQDKIILREDDLMTGNTKNYLKYQKKLLEQQYQSSMEVRFEDQDHKLNNEPRIIIPYSRKNPAALFNQKKKK